MKANTQKNSPMEEEILLALFVTAPEKLSRILAKMEELEPGCREWTVKRRAALARRVYKMVRGEWKGDRETGRNKALNGYGEGQNPTPPLHSNPP